MDETHDPQWRRFRGQPESSLTGLGRNGATTLGVGAYVCRGCDTPHVAIAAIIYDLEVDIVLTPADAREAAAALIAAANRVDAGGVH